MEINLAIFIMAVAVLGMVALYPLGFRENQHSREDVFAAAVADGILNPLVAALSATNLTWKAWQEMLGSPNSGNIVYVYPSGGWNAYCDNDFNPRPKSQINNTTKDVISHFCKAYRDETKNVDNPAQDASGTLQDSGMCAALVVTTGRIGTGNGGTLKGGEQCEHDYSRLVLALRVSRRAAQLLEQPVFYTEVRYQGNPAAKEGSAR